MVKNTKKKESKKEYKKGHKKEYKKEQEQSKNLLKEILNKRFLQVIIFVYILIIFYLKISNKLNNFLNPTIQTYLIIAGIIFLFILILTIKEGVKYNLKLLDLVLLIPIIAVILSGDGRLNESIALNRGSNLVLKNSVQKNKEIELEEIKEKDKIKDKENKKEKSKKENKQIDFEIEDDIFQYLADKIVYTENPDKIIGKTIKVRGFYKKDISSFSEKYSAIGKYLISCCAADSTFIGFVIDTEDMSLEDNLWYEIEGELERAEYDQLSIVIKPSKITKIDGKNEEIYIYPYYSYNNGSTEKVDKYDKYFDNPYENKLFEK